MVTSDALITYSIFELDTAAKYKIPVVCIVFNNNSWGMWPSAVGTPRSMHLYLFQENLRYDKMAEGLGARGEYVRTQEEFREALKRGYHAAAAERVSSLINVHSMKEFTSVRNYPPGNIINPEPGVGALLSHPPGQSWPMCSRTTLRVAYSAASARLQAVGAKTIFRMVWHHDRPFELVFDARARTPVFPEVLPAVAPDSAMYRALRRFIESRHSEELPAHRRVDPARASLRFANRRWSVSVRISIWDQDFEYATRKLVPTVHEIFLVFLNEESYSEYMVEHPGLNRIVIEDWCSADRP